MRNKFQLIILAVLMMLFVLPASAAYELPQTQQIIYGKSGEGRDLTAYRIGDGENVMVMTFALHGFEDNWDKDGLALVHTAEQVISHLKQSYLPDSYNWSVYILPCCNPDGLYSGYTNNGPGRCTTTYITENGTVSNQKGIDMNRSFPTGFVNYTNSRNYNAGRSLACLESKALAAFIQQVKGSKVNVLIDVHGWLQQIITSSTRLRQVLSSNFQGSRQTNSSGGTGYLISYANTLGYEAALLELPYGYFSMDAYINSGCVQKVISSVDGVMKTVPLACDQNGHRYTVIQSVAANCAYSGSVTEKCGVCAKEKTTQTPPLGHIEADGSSRIVLAPTASRSGRRQYSCSRCGQNDLIEILPSVFSDVDPNVYYADALDMCYEAGYIKGVTDTDFGPDSTLSRAMLVTILYRIHGEPEPAAPIPFQDVQADSYYENAVRWAYETGVILGTSPTAFSPNVRVTRQQAMAIFFRYAQYLGKDNGQRAKLEFADADKLGDFAVAPAQWSVANGIIVGEDGKLNPNGAATRAQCVTIVQRVVDHLEKTGDSQPGV